VVKWLWLPATAIAVPLAFACCNGDRGVPTSPSRITTSTINTDDFDAGVSDGPPALDAAGLCGNELHNTGYRGPNLYFVLDRSGSMATAEPPNDKSRYDIVRSALLDLTRKLGPLINVGAALFPTGDLETNSCHAGSEVFPVTQGDPVSAVDGPTVSALAYSTWVTPKGGTPTAATLQKITPGLLALTGRTVVLLATDGAPNCNANASCSAADCTTNIDGQCQAGVNCCAPDQPSGPEMCIDRLATVAAIGALHDAGVDVYIIGIPGSAVYENVLNDMAVAGGTAQAGSTQYYRVDDLTQLGEVFAAIAANAIVCEFTLSEPPTDPTMTNVYLDQGLIAYDPVNGWTWEGTDKIVLHGDACQQLKTGGATTVQVVTGCPTQYPP